MSRFSISQLGRFSGIKPHTIRAWEIRYQALKPSRSQGNTRYYEADQMKRLLAMSSLVQAGHKVSEVATLTDNGLELLLENTYKESDSQTQRYFISQLIAAGMTYNVARFDEIFGQCLVRYRLKDAYQLVLLPMLECIGLLWKCNRTSPSQEHFISNLIRQKLFTSAESVAPAGPDADKWLLFLPENEFHELGLLLAYSLIRLSGQQAIYLGANVPWSSMASAVKDIQPDKILFFKRNQDVSKYLTGFLKEFEDSRPGKKIYGAGTGRQAIRTFSGTKVQWLTTVEDLIAIFSSLQQ
jgi:DNA-binding transcriptional MerR regulator